ARVVGILTSLRSPPAPRHTTSVNVPPISTPTAYAAFPDAADSLLILFLWLLRHSGPTRVAACASFVIPDPPASRVRVLRHSGPTRVAACAFFVIPGPPASRVRTGIKGYPRPSP